MSGYWLFRPHMGTIATTTITRLRELGGHRRLASFGLGNADELNFQQMITCPLWLSQFTSSYDVTRRAVRFWGYVIFGSGLFWIGRRSRDRQAA
jgi:hypothetical protein